MTWTIVTLVLVIVIAAAAKWLLGKLDTKPGAKRGNGPDEAAAETGPPPFRRKDWLLTKGEAAFYHELRRAVAEGSGGGGPGRVVMAKVRLIDLVWLPRGTERRQAWTNRVQSKHVDFVVCDTEAGLRPLVVVELDDASHEREDRQERDGLVDQILQHAGLPIVRVRARGGRYDPAELRGIVQGQLVGGRA